MKTETATVSDSVLVSDVKVTAYKIPTTLPEADGTIEWNSTTLVLVKLEAGGTEGIGYTYAHEATALVIEKMLKPLVIGNDIMQLPAITSSMIRAIRNNGTSGIAMMAVSAVDTALWDAKAKILNVPLCTLLGKVREKMLIYGSGGFTSYTDRQLRDQLGGWAESGIRHVKMKVGAQPGKDVERAKAAREAIGNTTGLLVDANGAYGVKQAVEKARQFSALDVTWFEEPVPSDHLEGLHFIRHHAPEGMNIAAGEYGYNQPYFEQMLNAGAVDVLQGDATRCGGISGFLKAGHLCESRQVPYSSHCAPAIHLHAALALPSFYIAEYFYDHVRIENMLFEGTAIPENGTLKPDLSRPGLGFEFKHQDARKFKL